MKRQGWAVKWTSDGPVEYLMGGARFARSEPFAGYVTMVFRSREAARAFIREHYGYIAKRADLRRPPHCWRMPKPVKVTVTVTEERRDDH